VRFVSRASHGQQPECREKTRDAAGAGAPGKTGRCSAIPGPCYDDSSFPLTYNMKIYQEDKGSPLPMCSPHHEDCLRSDGGFCWRARHQLPPGSGVRSRPGGDSPNATD